MERATEEVSCRYLQDHPVVIPNAAGLIDTMMSSELADRIQVPVLRERSPNRQAGLGHSKPPSGLGETATAPLRLQRMSRARPNYDHNQSAKASRRMPHSIPRPTASATASNCQ